MLLISARLNSHLLDSISSQLQIFLPVRKSPTAEIALKQLVVFMASENILWLPGFRKNWLSWCGRHWSRLHIRLCCLVWPGVLEESNVKKQLKLLWFGSLSCYLPWIFRQCLEQLQQHSHSSHGGMSNKNMQITDTDSVKVSWRVLKMVSFSESPRNLQQLWGERSWCKLRQTFKQRYVVLSATTQSTVAVVWMSMHPKWTDKKCSWLGLGFQEKNQFWLFLARLHNHVGLFVSEPNVVPLQ